MSKKIIIVSLLLFSTLLVLLSVRNYNTERAPSIYVSKIQFPEYIKVQNNISGKCWKVCPNHAELEWVNKSRKKVSSDLTEKLKSQGFEIELENERENISRLVFNNKDNVEHCKHLYIFIKDDGNGYANCRSYYPTNEYTS